MSVREEILARWAQGMSSSKIAAELGLPAGASGVRFAVSQARSEGDVRAVLRRPRPGYWHRRMILREEAERRGLTAQELRQAVIEAVIDDNLFSAVLE